VYGDWRAVDNIKLPFKMSVAQDGRKFGDLITMEIKLNSGLKPDELAKKPDPPKPPAPPTANLKPRMMTRRQFVLSASAASRVSARFFRGCLSSRRPTPRNLRRRRVM